MRTNPEEITHRTVFRLAWPITVGMLSHAAMSFADTLFVGQLGTAQLAAVGVAAVGGHLVASVPYGLFAGVRVRIAHAIGAGRYRHARKLAWQGLWLVLPCSVLCWALLALVEPFFTLMGATPAMVEHGSAFLNWRLIAMPALLLFFALQAWFQGRGETRIPMAAVLLGNAANIVLDPLLIHGWGVVPAFGVAGASIATGIAWTLEVLVMGAFALRTLGARRFAPERAAVLEILWTGAPMAVHFVLDVSSFVAFVALLTSVGDVHLAAHVIVVRILAMSFLPGDSLAQAAGVLVGQSLGAGSPEGARRALGLAMLQAATLMAALGAVFVLVPGPLVALFGAEPAVAELAVAVLALGGLLQVFDAIAMVLFGALNGAGDNRFTMVAGFSVAWLVKLPLALVGVSLGLGVWGAWLGLAGEFLCLCLLGWLRVRRGAWLGTATPAPASVPA